jgi:hypothetical protein
MKRASVTLPDKYHEEANWAPAYRVAERAAEAGLGVTAHAGEVGEANIEAALGVPRLTRIGHAVAAAGNPRLLEMVAESGVTVESPLGCRARRSIATSSPTGRRGNRRKKQLAGGSNHVVSLTIWKSSRGGKDWPGNWRRMG